MLGRAVIALLLSVVFCVAGLPSMSGPKPKIIAKKITTSSADDPGLSVSTTRVETPDGQASWILNGTYTGNGGRSLRLRANTVAPVVPKIITDPWCPGCETMPSAQPRTDTAPEPTGDYEYSNSEMSKSDGTVLVETSLEYNESAERNMFYVTLNGVQFSVDLNAQQEVVPVSEEDRARVGQWLETEDGRLVQQAGIALIQQGQSEPENEALLTYWLVAMLVSDDSSTQAVLQLSNKRRPVAPTHHASVVRETRVQPVATDSCTANAFGKSLLAPSLAPAQCYGCCGPGCYCIPDWFGRPMYASQCQQHDACVGSRAWYSWQCMVLFYAAAQRVVVFRVGRKR